MSTTLKHITALASLVAQLALFAPMAQAAIVTYTTEASFLARVGNHGTDTFDDLIPDVFTPPPAGNSLARNAGSIGYGLNVGTFYGLFNNKDANNPGDVRVSPEDARRALNFGLFSEPVFGLGANFFITDVWGDATTGDSIRLTLTDINNVVTNLTLTSTTQNTYRGFVSTVALRSLSVIAASPLDDNWATVNNLTLASAVPEPASLALAALGLALAAVVSSRSRSGRSFKAVTE